VLGTLPAERISSMANERSFEEAQGEIVGAVVSGLKARIPVNLFRAEKALCY